VSRVASQQYLRVNTSRYLCSFRTAESNFTASRGPLWRERSARTSAVRKPIFFCQHHRVLRLVYLFTTRTTRHWSALPPHCSSHDYFTMDWLSKLGGSASAAPAKAPALSLSSISQSLPSIPRSKLPNLHHPYVAIGGASLGSLLVLGTLMSVLKSAPTTIISSPVQTKLPQLSEEHVQELPYPPNALPGARDVNSPYGSVRVYEWGPEDGDKVLLIHGISTPGIAMADLAHKLVRRGCRVMMFGRYSLSHLAP